MLGKWLFKNAIASDKSSLAWRCRMKRMREIEEFYKTRVRSHGSGGAILDLGGTFSFWKDTDFYDLDRASITLLNLKKIHVPESYPNISSVAGDATDLGEYDDNQFDLVFSNSVIEHVGDFEAQRRMAKEMMRVGKHCYLQTPNRYFFMEPHFLVPFFQFFPLWLKALLVRHFKMGHMPKGNTDEEAWEIAKSVRLLTKRELQLLFPGKEIRKEKFGVLIKSWYVYF